MRFKHHYCCLSTPDLYLSLLIKALKCVLAHQINQVIRNGWKDKGISDNDLQSFVGDYGHWISQKK